MSARQPLSVSTRAQLQIHLCVLLWGVTAILGKLITLSALPLVWWRMAIVVAALVCFPQVWRGVRSLAPRLFGAYAAIGVVVALHWLTFYGAIKLSNASVATTCIAMATVFAALLEPKIAGRNFSLHELALGIVVLPGVAMVVGGVPRAMRAGIGVGVFSAFLLALFGCLNKRLVTQADPLTVTAVELGAGTVALSALAPLMPSLFPGLAGDLLVWPSRHDLWLLAILALLCTLLPFALSLVALRQMSAFAAQLAVNLEPVYAIILAIIFLGEQRELTALFYLGVALIFAAVLLHPVLGRKRALD